MNKISLVFLFSSCAILRAPIGFCQESEVAEVVMKSIRISEADAPDITSSTGAVTGTFTPSKGIPRSFGGVLIGVRMNFDNTPLRFTPFLGVDALIDGSTNQVIRQSFGGGLHLYILGGKKRAIKTAKVGDIASSNTTALAFTIKANQDNYNITPITLGVDKLQGGVLNLAAGITATLSYTETSSICFEVTSTIIGLAASIENASASSTDIGLGWRFFL